MTAQTLQKSPEIVVVEKCHSLICRIETWIKDLRDAFRSHQARHTALRELRRLDARQLDDIGLGDPQYQRHLFCEYIDSGNVTASELHHRFDNRR